MKVKIEEISHGGLDLRETWGKDRLEDIFQGCGKIEGKFAAPVSLAARITKSDRDVFMHGIIETDMVLICGRCLEKFDYHLISDVKYTFCPSEDKELADDLELSSEDLGFSFYDGEEIDLSQVIIDQVILAMPFNAICHDACGGLCQHCGKNLNKESCDCSKEERLNAEFAKLRDFKLKVKSN